MTIPKMERYDGATSFPLSASQEQLWYLNQLAPGSPVYNVVDVIDLGAAYDAQILRKVAKELVRRHETLRTAFSYGSGQPMQVVLPNSELELLEIDLTSLPETEQEAEWARVVREQVRKPFDLSQAPLIRWTVVHRSAKEHKLLAVLHHIITDEWGTGILHKEVTQLYEDFSRGQLSSLEELPIQYADFACWQNGRLQGDLLEKQLAYWKDELAGAPQVLELTIDKSRPPIQSFRGAWESVQLPLAVLDPLKSLGRQERTTLFTTLLAGFMTLLYRYTGQDDILVGAPISLRRHSETENLVGYFLNTVILRAQFKENQSFRSLLQQVRKRSLGAITNAELPFNRLVAEIAPERDLSRTPLAQVAFILHDRDGASEVSKVSGKDQLGTGTSKFDLALYVSETKHGLDVSIEYSTDLFEPETIRRTCGHFGTLLEAIGSNPDRNIAELALLDEAERRKVVCEWNNTESNYPKDVSLAQLVEHQVQRTPNAVAVVHGKHRVTYRELNARANRLAYQLRKLGAGPDETVGVYLERSTDMIVALLAIVKAGAAYLPLDPLFPPDRLGYMLEDSSARLLVTQQSLRGDLPQFAGTMVLLEDKGWQGNASENLVIEVGPEHLAYLIYTSGSTGKPKGVQVPRGALTNLLWSVREWLQFSDRDRLLAVTTISFDIAAADVWLPLLVGAQLVVTSRESAADGEALRDLLEQHNITLLQATPITWRLLFDAGWRGKKDLQAVCTGEAMPPEVAAKLAPVVKRLWNLYGPTETTVWSTGYEVIDGEKKILIGRPLANTQCYILDAQRQPVPIGVAGELYIGGDGLARGYLNRPELTAEKFVTDPFGRAGASVYRTGDLARYMPDGNIECLGRIDHQVKVRGFRIELGEIEAILKDQPEIDQVVVIVREDTPGDKRLAAYYTSAVTANSREITVTPEQFRSRLSIALPEYMIPVAYVRMESLPLTPNGKMDRKALPAPEADSSSTRSYEPPVGETEMKLAAIWAEVLKLDRVGRHENFFDLGGHSLLAVQLMLRLQRTIPGEPVPLRAVLEAPTVERFAIWLQERRETGQEIIVQMRQGNSMRTPFFCVHASDGTALGMRPLAMNLEADLPFYCLQGKGLDGSAPFNTVEEAALCYLDVIRDVQPRGPYYLGGYCFGGNVVFEMARLLEELGEPVAPIVLIDSYNPAYSRFITRSDMLLRLLKFYVRRMTLHTRRIFSLSPTIWLGYTTGRIKAMYVHAQRYLKKAFKGGNQSQIEPGNAEVEAAPGAGLEQILKRLQKAGPNATRKFVPKPYGGDALVIRVSERNTDPYEDYFLGWRPVIKGVLESVEIDTTHEGILREPAVRLMAEAIESGFRKYCSRITRPVHLPPERIEARLRELAPEREEEAAVQPLAR